MKQITKIHNNKLKIKKKGLKFTKEQPIFIGHCCKKTTQIDIKNSENRPKSLKDKDLKQC